MQAAASPTLSVPGEPAQRATLERFIAARFRGAHGAHVAHYCRSLVGLRDPAGRWRAAAGFSAAAEGALFLEQYLDAPVEDVLHAATGESLRREEVVEVGNLAAAPGMGRLLIPAIGAYLHRHGYRWVVFTATRELRNAFRRLGLEPLALAPASAARLGAAAAQWGRYYDHDPQVMGGRIASCLPCAQAR
jgi:hypothetical protein